MRKKLLTHEKWKEIGIQAKQTENEMFNLYKMVKGVLSKEDIKELVTSINRFGEFISETEYIMFNKHNVRDFKIFKDMKKIDYNNTRYGEKNLNAHQWKNIGDQTKKTQQEMRGFCDMIWSSLTKTETIKMTLVSKRFGNFKSHSEDVMFNKHHIEDLNTFY